MAQISNDPLDVSSEFIESGKLQTSHKKKGGPYSKDQKIKRRNEVHRLRFGIGYSAREISELMKVNRNTINRDINFLHSQVESTMNEMHPEFLIAESIEKLNAQKIRVCELLCDSLTISEKISLEKIIFQIESKIIQIKLKLVESNNHVADFMLEGANKFFNDNQKDGRLISTKDYRVCSEKAKEKIDKILKEDKRF